MTRVLVIVLLVTICRPDWQWKEFCGPITGEIVCDTKDGEFV